MRVFNGSARTSRARVHSHWISFQSSIPSEYCLCNTALIPSTPFVGLSVFRYFGSRSDYPLYTSIPRLVLPSPLSLLYYCYPDTSILAVHTNRPLISYTPGLVHPYRMDPIMPILEYTSFTLSHPAHRRSQPGTTRHADVGSQVCQVCSIEDTPCRPHVRDEGPTLECHLTCRWTPEPRGSDRYPPAVPVGR